MTTNMPNITIVEDNDDLRESIADQLKDVGYQVRGCFCAEQIQEQYNDFHTHIYILDVNLPGEDGFTLAHRLRETYPTAGIIMLTTRNRLLDTLTGYDSGADIYLAKPVELQELLAVVKSLSKRCFITPSGQQIYLAKKHHTIVFNDIIIKLTKAEANLLENFMLATNQSLEYWQIMEFLGMSIDDTNNKKNLEIRITRLRKKFVDQGIQPHIIKAIRNHGYQLEINIQIC